MAVGATETVTVPAGVVAGAVGMVVIGVAAVVVLVLVPVLAFELAVDNA